MPAKKVLKCRKVARKGEIKVVGTTNGVVKMDESRSTKILALFMERCHFTHNALTNRRRCLEPSRALAGSWPSPVAWTTGTVCTVRPTAADRRRAAASCLRRRLLVRRPNTCTRLARRTPMRSQSNYGSRTLCFWLAICSSVFGTAADAPRWLESRRLDLGCRPMVVPCHVMVRVADGTPQSIARL